MQAGTIAECSIELPFVIKYIVLSIFEWSFYTGLTVHQGSEGVECKIFLGQTSSTSSVTL